MHAITPSELLSRLSKLAEDWKDPVMVNHLRGVKTFVVTLLIDADTNMTEAESLVDAALPQLIEL
jgi:hypothetical protein